MSEAAALRVLVACEYSGAVRDAFRREGCVAFSCDLLPSEEPGAHYQRDVREVLHLGWDIMVAHPPCTHLSVSGARWFKEKATEQVGALDFVRLLMAAPIPFIAIENPISVISNWSLPTLSPAGKPAFTRCRPARIDGRNARGPMPA
jgi:site-specific DNA-cytosine methylase